MNRCSKTGLTDKNFKTVLDVLNMYDPNDVAHVVPEMTTPEFQQEVQSAFKAVLAHVERINTGTSASSSTTPVVDTTNIVYEQYLHGLS
jgi:hypothetical protein